MKKLVFKFRRIFKCKWVLLLKFVYRTLIYSTVVGMALPHISAHYTKKHIKCQNKKLHSCYESNIPLTYRKEQYTWDENGHRSDPEG